MRKKFIPLALSAWLFALCFNARRSGSVGDIHEAS
jgi:hypothetical protein